MADGLPSLNVFKEKIERAVSMVVVMSAEDKLKAVQLWNVLSEKLQEIVNNSAADINALALQEPSQPSIPNFFHYSSPHRPNLTQSDNCQTGEQNHTNNKTTGIPRNTIEVDNSLASFSDIQCADDESIHMDGVCPIELPTTIEEQIEKSFPEEPLNNDKEKILKQFDCPECGLAFRTRGHLLDHSRKHTGERPFLCPDCGSSFTTGSNLRRHVKSHIGEKLWVCPICQDKFLEKKTLLVHMRRHTGEKPYECVTCKKRFSQLSILQSHVASHTNLRCHLCELCGKAFRQKSQMKIHLLRHKGDEVKRFSCKDCPMSFLTSSDYRRHVRVHTGERPFSCDVCGKKFTRLETLNDHMNRHNGLKPYECNVCGKSFSENSSYGKHMRKHNSDGSDSVTSHQTNNAVQCK